MAEALRSVGERLTALEPVWRLEAARLVPELEPGAALGPPAPDGRARFLEGLARALAVGGGDGTVLLDDLQWFDASSVEVLSHLARRSATDAAGPRLVATARPAELAENAPATGWLAALERRDL